MSIRSWLIKASIIVFLITVIFGGAAFFIYQLFEAPKKMMQHAMGEPTPTPPPDPSLAEFDRCMKTVKESANLIDARKALEDFTTAYPDSPKIEQARDELGDINLKLFFSDAPDPDKQQYTIQKGDTISAIERKTKVPGELIMRLNKIDDPTRLRIGTVLNVTKPQFALKIDHKSKRVVLTNNGKFFKQYKVSEWNAPVRKSSVPATTKVSDKSAWENNLRVPAGAKELTASGHWIVTNVTGYTLYSEDVQGVPKPEGGLGMDPDDMQELSTLINRGTPVTIE
ncbi:MAG TPA: LysM peptidoglycan-binding domain-containing protein [Chthoniobacteraceae bacterium]|nr:LysM peptidoglycan-binding domain-containing protein [Chthoniobacteraceae bacterium]